MESSVSFWNFFFFFIFLSILMVPYTKSEETCPNGDIAKNICWNIRPHHCYNENHRRRCCETCKNFPDTNITDCRYGDYYVIWDTEFGSYTCQSYVSLLGYGQCRKRFLFRSRCCESCHGHDADE